MSKTQETVLSFGILTVVLLAGGIWFFQSLDFGVGVPLSNLSLSSSAGQYVTYTGEKGNKWTIPVGKTDFNVVAAGNGYPKFALGEIDPLDVHLGQTQTMKVTIENTDPLASVVAIIEHDKGTDTVPLKLTGTKAVTLEMLKSQPYLVDAQNHLVFNDGSDKNSDSILASLVSTANAQGTAEYTYEGSWVVHDTHTTKYNTTFVAKTSSGTEAKYALAWSDPCAFSALGVLTASCNLSGANDGFDGAPVSLNAGTSIALGAGGVLAFNPGQSLTVPSNASISTLSSGSKTGGYIKKSYIYFTDVDGDTYTPSTTKTLNAAASLSGYVRLSGVAGGQTNPAYDCNDSQNITFPAPTSTAKWWANPAITDTDNSLYAGKIFSATNYGGDSNCDGYANYVFAQYNAGYQASGYPTSSLAHYNYVKAGSTQPTSPVYMQGIDSVCTDTGTLTSDPQFFTVTSSKACGKPIDAAGGEIFGSTALSFTVPSGYIGSWYLVSGGGASHNPNSCPTGNFLFFGSMVRACQ